MTNLSQNVQNANHLLPTDDARAQVPARLAARYKVVPLRVDGDVLVVAMVDPEDVELRDELQLALGCPVRAERADQRLIDEAIREFYGVGADTLDALAVDRMVVETEGGDDGTIDDMPEDASIIKFVNQVIVDAYNSRATDIHFEPYEYELRVRYRVDGILIDTHIPDSIRHFRDSIVSRIKIMANLDIAERRLPQDGRIRVRIGGKDFDLRVSVIPIAHGQSVNVRILQRSNVLMGLESIGYDDTAVNAMQKLIRKSHGIVLLTGPTGSGKTTTLYAALSLLNDSERKIITVEDPVEYEIPGICQMQVRPDIGFTFASGLRSMLRHDPDVMLIGEIRDFETAELAVRCSLTGHLVFSTLHTNDAPGAAPRLLDMGIEPYLLSSSLEAVIGQRLVRSVCDQCAESYTPATDVIQDCGLSKSDVNAAVFRRGAGCDTCRGTGYFDRTVIHELLLVDDDVRECIMQRGASPAIMQRARSAGMQTLRESGVARAMQGVTTLDEVLRVTQDQSG